MSNGITAVVFKLKPHHSTTLMRPIRWIRVVCLSLGQFVCLSVMIVSPAKTVEPFEMPFEIWTVVVGPRDHELD